MATYVRALFFGTPEIAVPALRALAEVAEIQGVICQPDRPAGRGLRLRPPAVKLEAQQMGLDVFQPTRMRDGELQRYMEQRSPDVALVIAYGRILPPDVLGLPARGCVNLHASLLPRYRGAAPIQRALMNGETETGVCLMKMDAGMDTGDVLSCKRVPIEREDNHGSLAARLAELAAAITRDDLPRFVAGELTPLPQDHERATHAPPITREETYLNFTRPARSLENQIRGLAPRPAATARLRREGCPERRLRILRAMAMPEQQGPKAAPQPGRVQVEGSNILVTTGAGQLSIFEAQLEGKKAQSHKDLLNGRSLRDGDILFCPTS